MTTFKDKENAAENKFARDQETAFKIRARRDKLLGLWAAGKMKLSGADEESYAKSIANIDIGAAKHDEAVLAKVKSDLAAKGVAVSDHDIREQMHALLQTARKELAK